MEEDEGLAIARPIYELIVDGRSFSSIGTALKFSFLLNFIAIRLHDIFLNALIEIRGFPGRQRSTFDGIYDPDVKSIIPGIGIPVYTRRGGSSYDCNIILEYRAKLKQYQVKTCAP